MYGISGKLANAQKHVEGEKKLSHEAGKLKHLMVAKNVLDLQPSPRPATLKNAQVKHRMYNKEFIIWHRVLFKKMIAHNLFLVDCEWHEWKIGDCSKTCGGGERSK